VVKLFLHLLCSKLEVTLIKGRDAGAFVQEDCLKLLVTSLILEYSPMTSLVLEYIFFIIVTSETQCASHLFLRCGCGRGRGCVSGRGHGRVRAPQNT
jgi:hypothetical protein